MASDVRMSMNALNDDLYRSIFSRCPISDLACLATACKRWRSACCDDEVVRTAFLRRWRLDCIQGVAPHELLQNLAVTQLDARLQTLQLKDFVFRHRVQPGDHLSCLALKFNTTALAIRVQNNLLSEHALRAHVHIYIPVSDEAFLAGKQLRFEALGGVGRIVPVVFEPSDDDKEEVTKELGMERVLAINSVILKNRLGVSEDVASFYASDGQGDIVASAQAYWEDLEWELDEGQALLRGMQQRKWHWPRRLFEFFTCGTCVCCYAAEW